MQTFALKVMRALISAWCWCALSSLPCVAAELGLSVAVSAGPVSLPIYVARENGYFERLGLQVDLQNCRSGRDCYQLLSDRQADLATCAEVVATLNSFKRTDLAFIASISTSSHQIKLVGNRKSGIAEPKDLVGKRVGTVIGSSAQFFLESWLLFHNINPSQVKVVPFAPDQLVGALELGQIDAVSIWEPFGAKAVAALKEAAVLLPNPRVYTQHFGLLTTRANLGKKEEAISKFLEALLEAERFIASHPKEAAGLLATKFGVDPSLAHKQLQEHDFRIRLDQSLASTISSQRRWAVREGFAEVNAAPGNADALPEPALLRRLSPKAVGLVQ